MGLGADFVFSVWVPDYDIGVTARGKFSLAWIETEQASRRGRNQLHKTVQADFSLADSIVIEKLKTILNARSAVGNLGEIVFPERLLIFETERTMICGNYLQMIVPQS